MAYNSAKNILVGASPLYISNSDSTVTGYVENTEPGVPRTATGSSGANKDGVPAYSASASYRTTLDAAQATAGNAYRNVGYTNNGLQITYNPTYDSVTVDQLLDTAKLFKSAMEVMIATEMAEGTLENTLAVFGQGGTNTHSGAITATNTLTTNTTYSQESPTNAGLKTLGLAAGALGVAPVERQLIAVGQGPTGSNAKIVSAERVYYARRVLSVQQSQFSLARNNPTTFPVTFRLLPSGESAYAGQEYGKIIDRILTVTA
jgi:hypothetical protein